MAQSHKSLLEEDNDFTSDHTPERSGDSGSSSGNNNMKAKFAELKEKWSSLSTKKKIAICIGVAGAIVACMCI